VAQEGHTAPQLNTRMTSDGVKLNLALDKPIAAQRAHTVLLDVTGVPIVNTQVANSLIQTARAAILFGARVEVLRHSLATLLVLAS
jgi:rsbT co-antagonist protein RsbR